MTSSLSWERPWPDKSYITECTLSSHLVSKQCVKLRNAAFWLRSHPFDLTHLTKSLLEIIIIAWIHWIIFATAFLSSSSTHHWHTALHSQKPPPKKLMCSTSAIIIVVKLAKKHNPCSTPFESWAHFPLWISHVMGHKLWWLLVFDEYTLLRSWSYMFLGWFMVWSPPPLIPLLMCVKNFV